MTLVNRLGRALALLLLAWQAMVVQTHVHTGVAAPVAVSAPAASSGVPTRPDTPYDCPVCREIAHAGHYLTPAPVLLAPPQAYAPWRVAAALPILIVAPRAPDWRSRAPPALHA